MQTENHGGGAEGRWEMGGSRYEETVSCEDRRDYGVSVCVCTCVCVSVYLCVAIYVYVCLTGSIMTSLWQ